MITLDSSGLFALLNRRDPDHERTKAALLGVGSPYLVPAGILAEVAYLVEQRIPSALDPFLADLQSGPSALTAARPTYRASASWSLAMTTCGWAPPMPR